MDSRGYIMKGSVVNRRVPGHNEGGKREYAKHHRHLEC